MAAKGPGGDKGPNPETIGVVLDISSKDADMGKEERKRLVLQLLVESGLELPPKPILHNLKNQGATFERTTLDNYLEELREEGLVERLDKRTGYHRATEKGRQHYLNR